MTTRLTLTMNEQVIKAAKKYAAKNGYTLSRLVAKHLAILTVQKITNKISPRVTRLKGLVSLPAGFKYKKALRKSIIEKYGK